jgi:hypothetical protein
LIGRKINLFGGVDMRVKTVVAILLAGSLNLNVNAGFEQFGDPIASVNFFDGNTYVGFFEYNLPDLQAITDDNRTFELVPNTALYENDPNWRSGDDGKYIMEANTLFELKPLTSDIDSATFTFNVDAFDLDTTRYSVEPFLKVLNPNNGYLESASARTFFITGTTNNATLIVSTRGKEGQILQAGWLMRGRNANPTDDWGSLTVTAVDLSATSRDRSPPDPDPMTFATLPFAVSDTAISMTATIATDDFYDVQYLFTNLVNNTSSGWQSSPTWVDNGPAAGVTTSALPIVNADFESGGTGWTFESNSGWGDPSGATTTNDSGNGAALAYVNGSEDNGNGGFAVVYQGIDLTQTAFSADDILTLSADIKALPGQNGGGAILKMESYKNGSTLNADKEVIIPVTTNWVSYSIDYTIASGADEVRAVVGTTTGWGGPNPTDSYYLFDNVALSGEVDIPSGLLPDTLYDYQVIARDTGVNANQTGLSQPASAKTNVEDNNAPAPNQMSFTGTDASPISVKLTAVQASDASEVEYFFKNTAGGGNDSGWLSTNIYYDTGLEPGATYSYTVIARDTSAAMNSNTVSLATNVTTLTVESGGFTNSLKGFTGSTDDPEVLFQLEKANLTTGSSNPDATINFSSAGAIFGDGQGSSGRNLLKTVASDYQGVSFEAYATLEFSGATDLSGFIGMGQGLQTGVPDNFGVPELNLEGVSGVVAQFKDATAGSGVFSNSLIKIVSGNPDDEIFSAPVASTEIIRARLTYDAAGQTVQVEIDRSYSGGEFSADESIGPVSTTNTTGGSIWDGAPVHVYVGGGEGTRVQDFEIIASRPVQPAFNIEIGGMTSEGGMIFSWVGESGYTYELQYKTNLITDVEWMTDTSPGASNIFSEGGAVSATSTVDSASVFYRILAK